MEKSVKNHILSYLKERNLYFKKDTFDGRPRITMSFDGYPNSPGKRIESCVYFYPRTVEIRVYYAEPGPQVVKKEIERLPDLFRLLNFVNASVFIRNMDGAGNELYIPSYLLQPRFYLTEDGFNDITATIVFEKDLFWVAPLEFEDFFFSTVPNILDALSPYIFRLLIGNIKVEQAINLIRQNILMEELDA